MKFKMIGVVLGCMESRPWAGEGCSRWGFIRSKGWSVWVAKAAYMVRFSGYIENDGGICLPVYVLIFPIHSSALPSRQLELRPGPKLVSRRTRLYCVNASRLCDFSQPWYIPKLRAFGVV